MNSSAKALLNIWHNETQNLRPVGSPVKQLKCIGKSNISPGVSQRADNGNIYIYLNKIHVSRT